MKVGIIQSNYIPWRGYFDFISEVDVFIFYDDMQFTKNDWRNRNKIKTNNGLLWLSVPVHQVSLQQLINETEIEYRNHWQKKHLCSLKQNYSKSPYVQDGLFLLEEAFSYKDKTISELNQRLIKSICNYLEIKTKLVKSEDFNVSGKKTERLISILKKVNASEYLSGPAAKDYLDDKMFEENNIKLTYKKYNYPDYPQLWGDFNGAVSILDLIANCGKDSINLIKTEKINGNINRKN